MKILFYAHSSTNYGANTSLTNLIIGIKKEHPETEITVILPSKYPIAEIFEKENIPFKVIPHKFWIYNGEVAKSYLKRNKLLFKLWYFKNKWQKGITNNIHFYEHINFAKNFDPDIIYINSSLSPMGAMVASKLKIPFLWHHRETVNEPEYNFYLEKNAYFKKLYNKAAMHLYTSQFLKSFYNKHFGKSNSLMVYNGVAFKDVPFTFKRGQNEKIKFGIVGRINKQKNQEEIIKMFLRLNNEFKNSIEKFELHIIGSGISSYVEKIIPDGGNIFYHGFLKKEKIYFFDYLIANSKNEAFGRTVAEANSQGIPVIARNSGAFPELVKNNKNGYLFNNIKELYEILKDIIQNRHSISYRELSENSRTEFEENFTIEEMSHKIYEQLEQLYKE